MCSDHALPAAGGVLDQDYQTMHRMQALDNIHRTVSRLKNMRGAEIHGLSDGERRILRSLRDMGMLYQ